MLATAAQGCGNLLLNIGPHGDGSVPEASVRVLEEVGAWLIRRWPGTAELTFGGLQVQVQVRSVRLLGAAPQPVAFRQEGTRVTLSGLPLLPPDQLCPLFQIECDAPPAIYQTGGLRIPQVPHPHYDPCPSDIQH